MYDDQKGALPNVNNWDRILGSWENTWPKLSWNQD